MSKFLINFDNNIGNLLEILRKDDVLILISDHGFGKTNLGFYINQWLIKNDYLKINEDKNKFSYQKLLSKFGITQRKLANLLDKLKAYSYIKSNLPKQIKIRFPTGPDPGEGIGESIYDLIERNSINWNLTRAIALSNGQIYIVGKKRFKTIETLYKQLQKIKLQGIKTIKVNRTKDIYAKTHIANIPDLIISINNHQWNILSSIPTKRILKTKLKRAEHRREGMYLIYDKSKTHGKSKQIDITKVKDIILSYY